MDTAIVFAETTQQDSHVQQQKAVHVALSSSKAESLVIEGIKHIRINLNTTRGQLTTAESRLSDTEYNSAAHIQGNWIEN